MSMANALLILSLMFAGCAKDEPTHAESKPEASQPTAPTPATKAPPTAATPAPKAPTPPVTTTTPKAEPKTGSVACSNPNPFSFDWSLYLSWSTVGAQDLLKRINGKAGKLGPLEQKYCIDLTTREAAYEKTLEAYGASATDGLTVTNMDVLALAQSRPAVAILPSSHSNGADGVLGPKSIANMAGLAGRDVHVLVASVSEYADVRCAQIQGVDPNSYNRKEMMPDKIALALAGNDAKVNVGVLWNPELEQTKRERPDLHVICDSSSFPDEIIDMFVVAQDALDRPGGDRFAALLAELFYDFNTQLKSGETRPWKALSKNFLDLPVDTVKHLATKTQMYTTPAEGVATYDRAHLEPIMATVVKTWTDRGHVTGPVSITYGDTNTKSHLRFTTKYMKAVK